MTDFDRFQLERAHKKSIFNKKEILDSEICGCFYCLKIYPPIEILEWVEENRNEDTPLCPYCNIDAVLGSKSGFPVTDIKFLIAMQKLYFANA